MTNDQGRRQKAEEGEDAGCGLRVAGCQQESARFKNVCHPERSVTQPKDLARGTNVPFLLFLKQKPLAVGRGEAVKRVPR